MSSLHISKLDYFAFPLFLLKGPVWFANVLEGNDTEDGSTTTDKKNDDDDKKNDYHTKVPYVYQRLYDVFLLCYVGYCLLMFYGCYTIMVFNDELLPIFGCVQLSIIVMKIILMSRWKIDAETVVDSGGAKHKTNEKLQNSKDNTLWYFNLPTYGGYVLLCLLEKFV